MKFPASIRSLVLTVFRRAQVENEMEEELRSHIQSRADDLERSGISRSEVERQARIEFGGYEHFKEECCEAAGTHFMETVHQRESSAEIAFRAEHA